MAEFLVRVTSKTSTDVYKDVKLTKRGDVICVVEDGHVWAPMELTHPDWRIFRWPSVSVTEGLTLIPAEQPLVPPPEGSVPDPMLQRRGYALDVDSKRIPADLRKFIDDTTRAVPYFDVPSNFDLSILKYKKQPRANPSVIG